MAEKSDEKPAAKPAGKLILFNHSKNPYILGKNPDGSRRMFKIGDSIECKDQTEFDRLRTYRGVSTTGQVAPSLHAHVTRLESEKVAAQEEIAELKKRLEKFEKKEK